jgi:hypothetical protein
MQTFLPYPSYTKSAQVLDRQRLGKQRLENHQLLRALLDPEAGYKNHPATKMWRGHELALAAYHRAIVYEWHDIRGYKDTMGAKVAQLITDFADSIPDPAASRRDPGWLGNPEFHRAHRSNLIRKDPEFYVPIFGDRIPPDLEYVWPVS